MSSIARNEGESFEDYKQRRLNDHYNTKYRLSPKLFWDSYNQGTYDYGSNKAKRKAKGN